jgi:hypothetical protein
VYSVFRRMEDGQLNACLHPGHRERIFRAGRWTLAKARVFQTAAQARAWAAIESSQPVEIWRATAAGFTAKRGAGLTCLTADLLRPEVPES